MQKNIPQLYKILSTSFAGSNDPNEKTKVDPNLLNWDSNSAINTSPVAQNISTPIMSEMSEIGDIDYCNNTEDNVYLYD